MRQMVRVVAKNVNKEIRVYAASTCSLIMNAVGTPIRHNTTTLYTLIPRVTDNTDLHIVAMLQLSFFNIHLSLQTNRMEPFYTDT